jgi:YVTN family beta-propeller protein
MTQALKALTTACLIWAQVLFAAPFALVCNSTTNTVTVIDVATKAISETPFSISPGVDPVAIAITPDGSKAYVCNNGSDTVSVVDVATQSTIVTIAVGVLPQAIALTPDGSKAFVCNSGGNTVTIIYVPTNSVVAVPSVGLSPTAVAVSSDGSKAYVCNAGDNAISIIDVATNTVLPNTIIVGDTPEGVAFAPNGIKAYVCNSGDSTISVINVPTDTVSGTIPNVDHPSSVVFSLDSTKALVTNSVNNTVSFIATATDTVMAISGVGSTPACITLTPDGSKAYVGNVGDGTVSVVNVSTDAADPNSISVNAEPYGIAMTNVPPPLHVAAPKRFTGKIIRVEHSCSHPRKGTLVMRWSRSSTPQVTSYQIFRHRKQIATISASAPRVFRVTLYSKHLSKKRVSKRWIHKIAREYRIRAMAQSVASHLRYLKITAVKDVDALTADIYTS